MSFVLCMAVKVLLDTVEPFVVQDKIGEMKAQTER